MGCFSLQWLEQILVYCIVVFAFIAIIRLLVPWMLEQAGVPIIGHVVNIILWAIVCIIVIYIVFALFSCLNLASLMPPTGHR